MSETPTIFQAMGAVMKDVTGVGKHGRNQQQNFSFRGIDDVLNAVGPVLRTHGVFLAPCVGDYSAEIAEVGKNRTPMKSVVLTVSYTFHGPAGDSVTVTVPGEAMDSGDKAFSKAMSVALRTALIQTFALPTNEKDPDADTYERTPRGEGEPQRPPQNGNGHQRAPQPQNGHNGAQRPAQGQEQVTKAAGALLDAADSPALEKLADLVEKRQIGDRDATSALTAIDRETLGLDDTDKVTLDDLVALLRSYHERHRVGPRSDREPTPLAG